MELDQLVDRPAVRMFEDGIDELVPGICVLLYAAALLAPGQIPKGRYTDVVGFSGPVLLVVMAFCFKWLRTRLRESVVLPRSGYVALREDPAAARRLRVLIWVGAAVAFVFSTWPVLPDYPHKSAIVGCVVFAGAQIYMGFRYQLRYLFFMGGLWLLFGVWMVIAHLSLIVCVLGFGLGCLITGAVKLWRFVNPHPVLLPEDAA